jgi:hypothetical protein
LIRTSFFVMAFALSLSVAASSASAMPLAPRASLAASHDVVDVKIICLEDGYCFHRGRRPVARWVYGEKNFSGPYTGPGYYGSPNQRWRWWLF